MRLFRRRCAAGRHSRPVRGGRDHAHADRWRERSGHPHRCRQSREQPGPRFRPRRRAGSLRPGRRARRRDAGPAHRPGRRSLRLSVCRRADRPHRRLRRRHHGTGGLSPGRIEPGAPARSRRNRCARKRMSRGYAPTGARCPESSTPLPRAGEPSSSGSFATTEAPSQAGGSGPSRSVTAPGIALSTIGNRRSTTPRKASASGRWAPNRSRMPRPNSSTSAGPHGRYGGDVKGLAIVALQAGRLSGRIGRR